MKFYLKVLKLVYLNEICERTTMGKVVNYDQHIRNIARLRRNTLIEFKETDDPELFYSDEFSFFCHRNWLKENLKDKTGQYLMNFER